MNLSIRAILFVIFLIVALIGVIVVNIFVNFFLENLFQEYAVRKQEEKNRGIRELVENQYSEGEWNVPVIQNIGISVLEEGLILHVQTRNRDNVWNAVDYNSGICQDMINQMTSRMTSRYPAVKGGLTHREYPLLSDDSRIGTLVIGYYGPFYYTEPDLFFIDTINRLLLFLTIILTLVAFLLAYFFSRAISHPIQKVSLATLAISEGHYDRPVNVKTRTREFNELISSINHLSEHLAAQESLRKRLTQDIAHELRTPLTTIQGQIEAYIDGVWEMKPEKLKSTHEEIIRLSALVKDLELLSHYDAENMKLNYSNENLYLIIDHSVQNFLPSIKDKNITVNYPQKDFFIKTDKHKLLQVFNNVLSNSIKYTPHQGKIDIKYNKKVGKIEIRIKDTGIGISKEHLPFVFQRFYRVDPSRTRSTGGSGIGLAICREIIMALEGDIIINSDNGKGTEVIIHLPQSPG